MFIACDKENDQAFGPFDSAEQAYEVENVDPENEEQGSCDVCEALSSGDNNCVTLPDGSCIGTGCMHDQEEPKIDNPWDSGYAGGPFSQGHNY